MRRIRQGVGNHKKAGITEGLRWSAQTKHVPYAARAPWTLSPAPPSKDNWRKWVVENPNCYGCSRARSKNRCVASARTKLLMHLVAGCVSNALIWVVWLLHGIAQREDGGILPGYRAGGCGGSCGRGL